MKKQEKRLAKRKLLEMINLLSQSEKKKMLEETRSKKVGTKRISLGRKSWIINNITDKTIFYEKGLLKPIKIEIKTDFISEE